MVEAMSAGTVYDTTALIDTLLRAPGDTGGDSGVTREVEPRRRHNVSLG